MDATWLRNSSFRASDPSLNKKEKRSEDLEDTKSEREEKRKRERSRVECTKASMFYAKDHIRWRSKSTKRLGSEKVAVSGKNDVRDEHEEGNGSARNLNVRENINETNESFMTNVTLSDLREGGAIDKALTAQLDEVESSLDRCLSSGTLKRWITMESGQSAGVETEKAPVWDRNRFDDSPSGGLTKHLRQELNDCLVQAMDADTKSSWMAALRVASNPLAATDEERASIFNAMQRRGFHCTVDLLEAALQEWVPPRPEALFTSLAMEG